MGLLILTLCPNGSNAQPVMIQPQILTTNGGATVTFTSTITNQAVFMYQWQFNETNIDAATNAILTLTNVLDSQSGLYRLVVSNADGITVSTNCSLTVVPWVIASISPNSHLYGQDGSGNHPFPAFSLTEGGFSTNTIYQWQHNGSNVWAWTGSSSYLIMIPRVEDGGVYDVVASDPYATATSSDVTLTVIPLVITTQPTNQAAFIGGSAKFNVGAAGGTPVSYHWQFNSTNLDGATNASLTLSNVQTSQLGTYTVVVSNVYTNLTSSLATLWPSEVAVWGGANSEANLTIGLTNIVEISGGQSGCLALKNNGIPIGWPQAYFGPTNLIAIATGVGLQTNGNATYYLGPVTGLTNIVAIAPDIYGYLALQSDGTVVGSASIAGLTNVVAISEGFTHSLALKSDGMVMAWGKNIFYGQTNVPVGLSNVISIAAGYYHSLALKRDGTVVGWGLNDNGQTNIPAGLNNVVAIAAGRYHSMALTANGMVVAWGQNVYGQTNVPATLSNVVAVAAGQYHSMALIGNGPPATNAFSSNPNFGAGNFSFSMPSQSGKVYVLQYVNDFLDSNWTSLPLVPGTGKNLLLVDPAPTNSQRFYRVQKW